MDNGKWYLQNIRKKRVEIKEYLKNEIDNIVNLEMAYHQIALNYSWLKRYDLAFAFYKKSMYYSELDEGELNTFVATGYRYTGDYLYRAMQYEKALYMYKMEIKAFENDTTGAQYEDNLINMYFKVGHIYEEIGKYSNSLYYYDIAYTLCNNTCEKSDKVFIIIQEAINEVRKKQALKIISNACMC